MTCNFHNWPTDHDHARPVRVRLIARWRRGADGKLECRWVPQFPQASEIAPLDREQILFLKFGGPHES